MTDVSVIIPVYNSGEYLRPCLDSILGQTLRSIEVLCVDAGSSDGSSEILKEYAQKDPRVTAFTDLGRLDAGAARNVGLAAAKGEFLSFLDSDDLFAPEMLEQTCRKAREDGSDIVIFQAQQLDMRTGKAERMPFSLQIEKCPLISPFSPEKMRNHIFNSFENWTWNKLFRKEMIDRYGIVFQSVDRTNDMAFTCQALVMAEKISIFPRVFATYRVGTGTSLQQTNHRSPTCFWEAYKETRRRLEAAGVYQTYQRSFLNAVMQGAVYNFRSVKTEEARQEILRVLKEEADVFGLDSYPQRYFYSVEVYEDYARMMGLPVSEKSGRLKAMAAKMPGPARSVMNCCADHGFGYTVQIAVKKVLGSAICKGRRN